MVIELDDFKVLEMPEIKTMMHPWLSYGSTHMIYAPRGAGKTFFAMSIGLAVAHGTDFGEWALKEPENVLYVDGEMLPQDMMKRIRGLESNLQKKCKKWYILSSGINLHHKGSAINIAKPYWQDYISNEVTSKDIKLLFLDNISALTSGVEENESSSWSSIASWQNKLKQTGCAIVIIHHAGKGGQQRGTSSREDALDTVIALRPTSKTPESGVDVDVIFEKSRHISGIQTAAMNFKILSEPGSGVLKWEMSQAGNSKRNEVIKLLTQGLSYREISERVGVSKAMVGKYKQTAIEKGWIQETEEGITQTKLGGTVLYENVCEF
jgi:RecA-family ATPase